MSHIVPAVMGLCFLCSAPASALNKVDASIAKYSAIFGNNRLAEEMVDEKGMALFLLARKLTPKADRVIVLEALLERQVPPAPIKTGSSEDKFIRYVLAQAIKLLPTDADAKLAQPKKCLAYYRLAQLYYPDDKDVIAGIARLRARGHDGSFNTAISAQWAAPEPASETTRESPPVAPEKPDSIDPKKLRVEVKRVLKKDKEGSGVLRSRSDNVELIVTVQNRMNYDISGLRVVAGVIAQPVARDQRGQYFVASRKVTSGIGIAARKDHKFTAINTKITEALLAVPTGWFSTSNSKHGGEYKGWFIILRDRDNKDLVIEASDTTFKKIAARIVNFGSFSRFDRKGEKVP